MPSLTPADRLFLEDAGTVVVSTDVDLPATRDEVWGAIADNRTWPDWFHDCRSCEGDPPVWTAAGQTRRIHVGALKIDEQAVEIMPNERWVMTVTRSNLPVASRLVEMVELVDTSTDAEARTEIRWTAGLETPLAIRPLQRVLAARFVDAWGRSLESLHDYLELQR